MMGRESSVRRAGRASEWKVSTRREESWVSSLFPVRFVLSLFIVVRFVFKELASSFSVVFPSLYRCVFL